jgi:hypothetical protein
VDFAAVKMVRQTTPILSPDPVLVSVRAAGMDPGTTYEMLPPGTYALCVSVGSKQGTPTIALPLEGGQNRRYPVGTITVER